MNTREIALIHICACFVIQTNSLRSISLPLAANGAELILVRTKDDLSTWLPTHHKRIYRAAFYITNNLGLELTAAMNEITKHLTRYLASV